MSNPSIARHARGLPMGPLLLCAGCLCFAVAGTAAAQPGQPPAPVNASPVIEAVTREAKSYVGTVLPLKRAVVGSAVDGRVTNMLVRVGDRIEAGGALAQLLTETIELELAMAEAELRLRQQELKELEVGSRTEEIAQAEAQLRAAKALADFTQARARRNESLLRQSQGISSDEVEESLAAAERATQGLAEAKATYDLAVLGPREERKEQARARVAMQQAIVEQTRDRIQKHTIISRFAGYVVSELAEDGQWVKQGEPVAEVVHLDTVEVEIHVVEQVINQIHLGSTAWVEVTSAGNVPFEGKISAIVPQADVRTRTFPVRIEVPNRLGSDGVPLIKSGMYARVKFSTGSSKRGLLVHKDALVLGGPTAMVYAVTGGKTRPVPVELGAGIGDLIQIKPLAPDNTLKEGDQVVIEGNERLRPGQEVRIVETREINIPGTPNREATRE